jgi:hypothetical protein
MASSRADSRPQTRTIQQPQPDGPNPNQAESMVNKRAPYEPALSRIVANEPPLFRGRAFNHEDLFILVHV